MGAGGRGSRDGVFKGIYLWNRESGLVKKKTQEDKEQVTLLMLDLREQEETRGGKKKSFLHTAIAYERIPTHPPSRG